MTEILLFVVGIAVGAMNAIAGGGMLIGWPTLIAVGLTPLSANVTGWFVILPGQLASVYGYRKYLFKLPIRYALLLLPCLVGGAIGALILRHTSNARFAHLVPGLILFAILLFAIQPLLHFHLNRHISKRSRKLQPLLLMSLVLLPMAAYGGFFGPGFGFIMLALLGFTNLRDIHQMNALKNIAGTCIAITATLCLLSTHLINWPFAVAMAAGNAVGGYGGSRFSQRFSSHSIRIVVIIIGLVAATYLFVRDY